jgi:hypothetical protein
MTERKKFKQRVRERMRRTGESYAAARRHVEVERPQRGATLTVRAIDARGAPVEGALVRALPGHARTMEPLDAVFEPPFAAPLRTGADGRARFEGLDPGACSVVARRGFEGASGHARVEERGESELTLRLAPLGVGHARLRLVEAEDGAPVQGLEDLRVALLEPAETARSLCLHAGRLADGGRLDAERGEALLLDLRPGRTVVTVWDPRHAVTRVELAVVEGEVAEAVVPLRRAATQRVRIDGHRPLAAGTLFVERPGAPRVGVAETYELSEGGGVVTIGGVLPGDRLSLSAEHVPGHAPVTLDLRVGDAPEVTLRLDDEGPVLRVVDAAGAPVRGAWAWGDPVDGGPRRAGPVDGEGRVRLHGARVTRVGARAEGHLERELAVELGPGDALELTLEPTPAVAPARLDGRVVDASGAPLVGVQVSAWPEQGGLHVQDVTRRDGRFSLRELPAGTPLTVEARRVDLVAAQRSLTLAPGEGRELAFALAGILEETSST